MALSWQKFPFQPCPRQPVSWDLEFTLCTRGALAPPIGRGPGAQVTPWWPPLTVIAQDTVGGSQFSAQKRVLKSRTKAEPARTTLQP